MRAAFKGLGDARLDTPYRDGGWTPRQVAHHVAESHMNAYIRFKLALTESNPTVKPYDEDLPGRSRPTSRARAGCDVSRLLESLHTRWVTVLETMKPRISRGRCSTRSTSGKLSLDELLQMRVAWQATRRISRL